MRSYGYKSSPTAWHCCPHMPNISLDSCPCYVCVCCVVHVTNARKQARNRPLGSGAWGFALMWPFLPCCWAIQFASVVVCCCSATRVFSEAGFSVLVALQARKQHFGLIFLKLQRMNQRLLASIIVISSSLIVPAPSLVWTPTCSLKS